MNHEGQGLGLSLSFANVTEDSKVDLHSFTFWHIIIPFSGLKLNKS